MDEDQQNNDHVEDDPNRRVVFTVDEDLHWTDFMMAGTMIASSMMSAVVVIGVGILAVRVFTSTKTKTR